MEIERKWIVDKEKVVPMLKVGVRIEQHYINDLNDEWLIRARKLGSVHLLTLKNEGLISRDELEYDITEDDYLETIKFSKKSVNKTRFYLDLDPEKERYFEIDVFDDHDFIICEVEFETVEEADSFVPPEWCVEEVTDDSNYQNVNLTK